MNKKGITLIELLIVIAIIGILAAIAVPAYIGQQRNAARTEAYSNLQNLRLLEEQYYAENGCYYMTGAPSVCKMIIRMGFHKYSKMHPEILYQGSSQEMRQLAYNSSYILKLQHQVVELLPL